MKTFIIDSLPESGLRYGAGWAVVAIDVIRATTMAITAAAMGRRCLPVVSLDAALDLGRALPGALLAGELGGEKPASFHINNSPAALVRRRDVQRPLVMLSSSGTRLIANARDCDILYLGCFRNSRSLARRLVMEGHPRVALLGAGSRGESRPEDQICCAWIGAALLRAGYAAGNSATAAMVDDWCDAPPTACLLSKSVSYLWRTGQLADLWFVLDHIEDLESTFIVEDGEIVMTQAEPVRPVR